MWVLKGIAVLFTLIMQAYASDTQLLYIAREFVKPGAEARYIEIEQDASRLCRELKCPHAYIGIESLTGPKQCWWFNGFASDAELKQTGDGYKANQAVTAALAGIAKRKADLISGSSEMVARYRPELSRGPRWSVGQGRFLVIVMAKGDVSRQGTVFQGDDGTRFVITSAHTREEAEAQRAAAGPDAIVFTIRPDLSMPAGEWRAADTEFWKSSP